MFHNRHTKNNRPEITKLFTWIVLTSLACVVNINSAFGQLPGQKYSATDSTKQTTSRFKYGSSIINDAYASYAERFKTNGEAAISDFSSTSLIAEASPKKIPVYNSFSGLRRTEIPEKYILREYSAANSSRTGWQPRPIYRTTYAIGIRTNLLFDIVGAPNVGIEFPIGWFFSVAGDFTYSYWHMNSLYALQTIQGSIEGRYWFNSRRENLLTGWNVGLYGTYCSRYDIQLGSGYQGDGFWSAGVSAGYSLPISYKLNLDFSLGAGYFYTPEVRHYNRPEDGHLIWEETRYNVGRFSLTRIKINLVWMWDTKKRME